jgi:hypothetical protein
MLVLVATTAAVGLLSSFLLLKAGLTSMEARYPLSIGIAYLAFLALVGLWLRRFRLRGRDRRADFDLDVDLDIVEVPLERLLRPASEAFEFGGAGGFSGSGGGATWGEPFPPLERPALLEADLPTGGSGSSFSLELDDEVLLVLLLVGALATGVLIYVVWTAPALFAELLLDAGLAAGLYRRLAGIERRRWLVTAIRRTIIPACIVAMLLGVAGTAMQLAYPDAVSIGGVTRHLLKHRSE